MISTYLFLVVGQNLLVFRQLLSLPRRNLLQPLDLSLKVRWSILNGKKNEIRESLIIIKLLPHIGSCFAFFGIPSARLKENLSPRRHRNVETTLPRIQIVKFCLKLFMFSIGLIHCYLLTKSRYGIILSRILHYIACSVMHQFDWPFVILANTRSTPSAPKQLRLSFVILPNEVHLFC